MNVAIERAVAAAWAEADDAAKAFVKRQKETGTVVYHERGAVERQRVEEFLRALDRRGLAVVER